MNRGIPAMAEWILARCGVPQGNQALIGDLMEERASGRSAFWLWRQVVSAVATAIIQDVRRHPLLTTRAVAMGWALWWLSVSILNRSHVLDGASWIRSAILLVLTFTLWPALIGWTIAYTHRTHRAATVLAYAASGAIYQICYIALHYWEINNHGPKFWPGWLEVQIGVGCIGTFFTLVGGFIQKPAERLQP